MFDCTFTRVDSIKDVPFYDGEYNEDITHPVLAIVYSVDDVMYGALTQDFDPNNVEVVIEEFQSIINVPITYAVIPAYTDIVHNAIESSKVNYTA